jgi:acyl-CoA synthetase (NDP forming)
MSEHPLDPIFHPRAVAIVGLSSSPTARPTGFLAGLLDQGFDRERIYPVNPRATAIAGLRCYASVLDCPEPLDHVISIIPRAGAAELLAQCIARRVRSVHFFTAGFSEVGDPALAAAERAMVDQARAAGVRLIGPNCMGLYVPGAHVSWFSGAPREPGSVFALSQSGVNASAIVNGLVERGARFSKCISFGNAADVAAPELFDYAASDAESETVVAYLESVRDGRALFEAVRRCARVKPTVLLKGGITEAGARAAQSHTGSLAGSAAVFAALCRQTGALQAESMEELHDLTVALTTQTRRVRGRRTILIGIGGGFSVLSADAIARAGLDLPELPPETQDALHEHVPEAGNSVRNPVDATFIDGPRQRVHDAALKILAEAPHFDAVIAAVDGPDAPPAPPPPSVGPEPDAMAPARPESVAGHARSSTAPPPPAAPAAPPEPVPLVSADFFGDLQDRSGRPLLIVRRARDANRNSGFTVQAYRRGVAVFPSVPRAARAVAQLLAWHERRAGLPELS